MSIFAPSEYLCTFGKCMMYACQSAYATSSFKMTEGVVAGGGGTHGEREYTISPVPSLNTPCEITFESVVTKENFYKAWDDFVRGKRKRPEVNDFALRLSDNLSILYEDLVNETYTHGLYDEYIICDPKKRVIHKASVRDRIVHRLLYNALYPHFDRRFIHDSYSCRVGKGTHKARKRFRAFVNRVSKNYTKQCYILKFDIKKCFLSVDQDRMKTLMRKHIKNEKLFALIKGVIDSFEKGLPLGNLTSQLFINSYLHELDYYVKHVLGISYYIRYADDVVVFHSSPKHLKEVFGRINLFITNTLNLTTHKAQIQSIYSGVDVLGEVFFGEYSRERRSTTRRRNKR